MFMVPLFQLMGNSEDKNSSILAYNSGLEEESYEIQTFTIVIFSV